MAVRYDPLRCPGFSRGHRDDDQLHRLCPDHGRDWHEIAGGYACRRCIDADPTRDVSDLSHFFVVRGTSAPRTRCWVLTSSESAFDRCFETTDSLRINDARVGVSLALGERSGSVRLGRKGQPNMQGPEDGRRLLANASKGTVGP